MPFRVQSSRLRRFEILGSAGSGDSGGLLVRSCQGFWGPPGPTMESRDGLVGFRA